MTFTVLKPTTKNWERGQASCLLRKWNAIGISTSPGNTHFWLAPSILKSPNIGSCGEDIYLPMFDFPFWSVSTKESTRNYSNFNRHKPNPSGRKIKKWGSRISIPYTSAQIFIVKILDLTWRNLTHWPNSDMIIVSCQQAKKIFLNWKLFWGNNFMVKLKLCFLGFIILLAQIKVPSKSHC